MARTFSLSSESSLCCDFSGKIRGPAACLSCLKVGRDLTLLARGKTRLWRLFGGSLLRCSMAGIFQFVELN
jgi:hypothetical protein